MTDIKKGSNEFSNILCKHDIVFLYETWCDEESDIDISGYVTHNFYRKFKHRKARRSSGGVALLYKEEIKDGIEILANHHDSVIWLRLDKGFFHLDKDVFICGIYLWGEDSPCYNAVHVDFFELLQQDINEYENEGSVFLIGDFNSRVGIRDDFIIHDIFNGEIDFDDYLPDVPLSRASSDKTCNAFGLKLIDLCKATGCRIANGRLGKDAENGMLTYVSGKGASVIDYLLVRENDFSCINDFNVHEFNEWSDHAPLSFSLSCNFNPHFAIQGEQFKCCWNDGAREEFRRGIIGNLHHFNGVTGNIDIADRKSINECINNFTDIIRQVADPLFGKQYTNDNINSFSDQPFIKNKEWFDDDCIKAKRAYQNALYSFNKCKSHESRQQFCLRKKEYKNLIRRKRKEFEIKKVQEIENLRHSKPKDFWKYFRNKKKNNSKQISLEAYHEYFSKLGNDIFQSQNEESEEFSANHDFNDVNSVFPELNNYITVEEVIKAVKQLKKGKSGGNDLLINEYFIESCDILSSHMCDIFNAILDSGYFPDKWTEGVIIPLYKKGDKDDVNNYRGITLVSCLSKIFTTILNKRIVSYCEQNNVLSDCQFGFRKGKSTVDALFILNSIVQKYLNEKKRLYCVFVDFKKAFDCIYRNALWLKLYKVGIDGKVLRIIRDMYDKVKSCVRACNNYSEFFEYAVGLRQGEIMSPILFSLYLEDLELYLQGNVNSGLSIEELVLILMLFADDMVILGDSPQNIQNSIDLLNSYCKKWSLAVNTSKTKVMVFRKRGGLLPKEVFTFNESELEIVDNFNYLGAVFNYTGTFVHNQEQLVGKALKALNVLLINCRKIKIKPKLQCQLFDSFVGSILGYASEIWGHGKSKVIERIHLKFCKSVLNVRTNTSSMGVYGELGRYPLYISRYLQILKYWFKLLNTDNIILKTVYKMCLEDCNKGCKNWLYNVKQMLNNYGFAYIWDQQHVLSIKVFIMTFKQRLLDNFYQSWYADKETSPVLQLYHNIKTTFGYETYLDVLPINLRMYLAKLRLSAHSLHIQTGRYARNRVPRNERRCLFCDNNDIEDEFHFVVKCSCFSSLRKKYLKPSVYTRPSMFKFIEMLKSDDTVILMSIAKFLKYAFALRFTISHNS